MPAPSSRTCTIDGEEKSAIKLVVLTSECKLEP